MSSNISVVIPYFKAESTIVRALSSIKAQTYPVKEVIIVNDGSNFILLTELVAKFNEHLHIILIDLVVNSGAANARNIGVKNSSGRFVAFLDADDVWHADKISIQYGYMCRTGAFLTCHGYIFDLKNHSIVVERSVRVRQLRLWDFLWRNHIFTPTVMVLREKFVAFDSRLSRSEDLKCWISNLLSGDFLYLSVNLAGGYKRAVGESGLSASYSLMHEEYVKGYQ